MKRIGLFGLLAMGLALWSSPASYADPADDEVTVEETPADDAAEDEPAEDAKPDKGKKGKKADKEEKKGAETSAMAQALKKVKWYTRAKVNTKAKYYVLLFSTSSCAHCNRTMPGNVDLYKKMRKADVEVILVTLTNMDNAAAARDFLSKYKAPFAGATDTEMKAAGVPVVDKVNANGPGCILALPPYLVFVDADGNVLHHGPGSMEGRNMMEDWRKHTIGEDPKTAAKEQQERARAEKKNARKKK